MTPSKAFNFHSFEWREIRVMLGQRRSELVERLVSADDAEVRGRIKEIDQVLSLDKQPVEDEPPPVNY